jgi:hypothetical protein
MDGEFEGTRVETRVGGIGRADDAPMRKAVRGFHHGGLCAPTASDDYLTTLQANHNTQREQPGGFHLIPVYIIL